MRREMAKMYKLVKGNALTETVLSNADYPASGSYIDVSGYRTVDIMITTGTLADAVVFEVKQTDAADGTLATIDATNCKHTVANDDDGEMISFHIETDQLTVDKHFISVVVSGCSGSNYADIVLYLGGVRHLPVTQTTALLPAASQHSKAG